MAEKTRSKANSIDLITKSIEKLLEPIIENYTKLFVTCTAISARMETLEQALNSGNIASKRAVRTTATKNVNKSNPKIMGGTGSDPSKVTNAMLYFRHLYYYDRENVRSIYITPEKIEELKNNPQANKVSREEDENQYFSNMSGEVWKSLHDDIRAKFRNQYKNWHEENIRNKANPPLEEEQM